jgi:hypothetical protein
MASKVPVWILEEYLLDRYRTGGPRPFFGYCEAEDTIADHAVSAAVLNLLKAWHSYLGVIALPVLSM